MLFKAHHSTHTHREKKNLYDEQSTPGEDNVLGACDVCLSKLNQEEECWKFHMRGRNIHVLSGRIKSHHGVVPESFFFYVKKKC